MLAETKPDIVDVVTPSHTHRAIATDVLNAGCDLLLEKPMALTVEDCQAIVKLAEARGRKLAVGHELRLSSQWGEIKRLIDRGTIGEPQYVLVELLRKPYRQGAAGWRYDPLRVGSWVLEEPIHFFDLARWYLHGAGDPVELYAYGNSRDPRRPELFDNFSAMFKYANGAYAVVSQTLAAFEHHQTVKVAGTKGALWAGWSGATEKNSRTSKSPGTAARFLSCARKSPVACGWCAVRPRPRPRGGTGSGRRDSACSPKNRSGRTVPCPWATC
jgi:myo-inositol 2-dehydrogenase/D-chiro-inositol 1-dehydrogenase